MEKSISIQNKKSTNSTDRVQINLNHTSSDKKKNINKKKQLIIILIGSILLVLLSIVAIIIFLKKKRENQFQKNNENKIYNEDQGKNEEENNNQIENIENYDNTDDNEIYYYNEYKNEFNFKTKVNDLKKFNISQKYYENMIIDGIETEMNLYRYTDYNIYIISEEELNDEFYNKIYTGVILMDSYCLSLEDENCIPKELLDLTSNMNNTNLNLRNLKELDNLKDIPIPICLFNLTNNNIITSIKCPESLPESKKNEIISDLYYFRPTPIKLNENIDNIDMNIYNKSDIKIITKNRKGICNIKNENKSICNSEMNITKDFEGNLLTHEEISIINISTNSKNSFKTNKITKFNDKTNNTSSLDHEKYKINLFKLLNELEPYMKYEKIFSKDIFQKINDVNYNKEKLKRVLQNNNIFYDREETLFNKEIFGVNISLNLKNNPGINSQNMKVLTNLKFNDEQNELVNIVEFTDLNKILKKLKLLCMAGNNLAKELYEKIKDKFDILNNEISIKIKSLNNFIIYKDLTEIFDSSLTLNSIKILPISILEESNNLEKKIGEIFKGIKDGNMKKYTNIIKDDIYDYLKDSYKLVYKIFNNLKDTINLLSSKNIKLNEIEKYYLNSESISYANIIKKVEKILLNYYKNEVDLINPKVNSILIDFEKNLNESIKKEKILINNLYNKLQNKSFVIENSNNEQNTIINNNLLKSLNYISDILNLTKTIILNDMNIKDNEYFVYNNDVNLNNQSFNEIITKGNNISHNLDNKEYIDEKFDEIMINFKENYTNILKYMENKREEKFSLEEDVLKFNSFSKEEKKKIKETFDKLRVELISQVENININYINRVGKVRKEFYRKNKEELDKIIYDLNSTISKYKLEKLSNLFNIALNSSLEKIKNDIENNKIIAMKYINNISNLYMDKSKNYELTKRYLTKYNLFKDNLVFNENYLKYNLSKELYNHYINPLNSLNKYLQLIINFNNNYYNNYKEINYYNYSKVIYNLKNRLHKFISNDTYNKYYSNLVEQFKNTEIQKLNETKFQLERLNNQMKISNNYLNDTYSDLCSYNSKPKCFTVLETPFCINQITYDNCIKISSFSNNIINIKIDSDENIIKFKNEFDLLNSLVYVKINNYNLKFEELRNSILNIEEEIINKNINISFQNDINMILSQKFGDELVINSFNYYKTLYEERIKDIFNNIIIYWNNTFDALNIEINSNLNNFKSSIIEFDFISSIYEYSITNNITKNYFDSIIINQKNDFNYTISYYYNYLLYIINSCHQYIKNRLPSNKKSFESFIIKSRNQIDNWFNDLVNNITNNEINSLNINDQIRLLHIDEIDFFNNNYILTDNILKTKNILTNKVDKIIEIDNYKLNDDYSIISKIYLENLENKNIIQRLYQSIDKENFIDLNINNFKSLINDFLIFDPFEIINKLNLVLYNINYENEEKLLNIKENYTFLLEAQINQFFTKESIEEKINSLYLSEIKTIDENIEKNIYNNIKEILNKINDYISKESIRLLHTATSYTNNFQKINNTINDYKEGIYNKIKNILFDILNNFYQNIKNNFYHDYIEKVLDNYITEIKKYTLNYKEYKLLNSSYKIGDIINNIIEKLVNEYKEIGTEELDYQHYKKSIEIFILKI